MEQKSTLKDFVVLNKLGEGSFCQVFKGKAFNSETFKRWVRICYEKSQDEPAEQQGEIIRAHGNSRARLYLITLYHML